MANLNETLSAELETHLQHCSGRKHAGTVSQKWRAGAVLVCDDEGTTSPHHPDVLDHGGSEVRRFRL